ncbi:MAG: DUF222 domain-containing protein, partial [Nakamurella sp.]
MFVLNLAAPAPPSGAPVVLLAEVTRHLQAPAFSGTGEDAAELIDLIRAAETLKSALSGAQARWTAEFAAIRETEIAGFATASQGDRARRDVGAQIGLARRVSPRVGAQRVGLAKVLVNEMPATMDALRTGRIDEYQATLVVAETATLSREHRQVVDAELAARYGSMTPRQARAAAARIGDRLDAAQAIKRLRKGLGDRCVTLRPAPDTMSYLTALLPVAEGVAVYAALTRHAASATAAGDPRGKGALMVDELVQRLVRPADPGAQSTEMSADSDDLEPVGDLTDGLPGLPAGVGVEIQLVMTDRTLLDGDVEPAILTGYGPIPAPLARHLVRTADPRTRTWVRRLYADPGGGRLINADTTRRLFSHAARQFLVARDQVCRTPWCGATIQHADHTRPHARGGPTDPDNGAGLCAGCNQTKEQPGWISVADA